MNATELETLIGDRAPVTLLDVRRKPAYDEDPATIAGAVWRDPAEVARWGAELTPDRPVVCYCVHGHEVSQSAAAALRDLGLDACYLSGGIDGWKDHGGPLTAKE
jgi:Fe-Mn family superoxide dismutase